MPAEIISALIGAVIGLIGAYALLRKLPGELREGREKVNKLREESRNLEEQRDLITAQIVESITRAAQASISLSEKTCEERISALEDTIEEMEKRYTELERVNQELRDESDKKINGLRHNLAELVMENDFLKNRIAEIAKDVQSVTGRNLLQNKVLPGGGS